MIRLRRAAEARLGGRQPSARRRKARAYLSARRRKARAYLARMDKQRIKDGLPVLTREERAALRQWFLTLVAVPAEGE